MSEIEKGGEPSSGVSPDEGAAAGANHPLEERLSEERVHVGFAGTGSRKVLKELARLLGGNDRMSREAILDDLVAREQLSSTGVGGRIAFPHARVDVLSSIRIAFVRTSKPIEFRALDGKKVDLFFGVAGPLPGRREYLSVLSRLSYLFRSESVRDRLRALGAASGVVDLLDQLESESPSPPSRDRS